MSSNQDRITPRQFAESEGEELDLDDAEDYYNYVREHSNIGMREQTVSLLSYCFLGAVVLTFLIFFLHGFEVCGFSLPGNVLNWLGAAVVGEIATLLAIGLRYLFSS